MRYKKSLLKKFLKIHRQAPMPAARFKGAAGLNLVFRVLQTFSEFCELFQSSFSVNTGDRFQCFCISSKGNHIILIHGCGDTVGGRPQP